MARRRRIDPVARDRLLDGAVAAGKFSKIRREHYERLYAQDPEGTTAAINAMAGLGTPLEPAAEPEGFNEAWLSPPERERVAAIRAGALASRPKGPTRQISRGDHDVQTATTAAALAHDGAGGYNDSLLSPAERARATAIKEGRFEHPTVHVERNA